MTITGQVGGDLFRMGDSGLVVEAVQLALRGLGYQLKGTGYFGNATDTAVRAFQRRAGVKTDGVVGETTARALDAATGPAPAPITAPPKAEVERPLWLQAGLALVGTKETPGPGDNQEIIDWAKSEGGDIAKEYKHDSIPWCALFINHILTKSSLPGTESLWALDFAGNWPSKRLAGPAVGAIAPMVRPGGGHVICVVGRAANGNVMGLGGNQHDMVSVVEFARSRLNRGFWWPESVELPASVGFDALPVVRSDGTISTREA